MKDSRQAQPQHVQAFSMRQDCAIYGHLIQCSVVQTFKLLYKDCPLTSSFPFFSYLLYAGPMCRLQGASNGPQGEEDGGSV